MALTNLIVHKKGVFMIFGDGGKKHNPIFLASRALIKNRLDTSANLAPRGMHAKFQLIWTIRLVRAMGGGLEVDVSSYNRRQSVYQLHNILRL